LLVDRLIAPGGAAPDIRKMKAIAAIQRMEIPGHCYGRRDQWDEHRRQVGAIREKLLAHVRARTHYGGPRSPISKLPEALCGDQLIAPARRDGDGVPGVQTRVRELDRGGRQRSHHHVGAEYGNGDDVCSAFGRGRVVHGDGV
jgi:hypothetical protein